MPRPKSMKTIDAKISAMKSELERVKARYNQVSRDLLKPQKEKEALEAEELYSAFKKSRKTYRELMTFLGR